MDATAPRFEPAPLHEILPRVAADAGAPLAGVAAVIQLLDEGNTVPFISRYRKEATGNLDDGTVTLVRDALAARRELEERRATVLNTIAEQGKLTPELEAAVRAADTRTVLEDLYLPYRPKRKTRAGTARERGLEPLAERMWNQFDASGDPLTIAAEFVDPEKEVPDAAAALQGARDIVAERLAETAELREALRDLTRRSGELVCKAARGKQDERSKYEDYYDFSQRVGQIPPHRVLAIRRGENEGYLSYRIGPDPDQALGMVTRAALGSRPSIWEDQVREAAADAWKRLLSVHVETELRLDLKQAAEAAAIDVFAANLKDLLLAAPFGPRPVLAIDPGLRTGCKVALLDATGRLLEHGLVWPTAPRNDLAGTAKALDRWFAQHGFGAVAVGNGTGGRETFDAVRRWAAERAPDIQVVLVSESGASVYSASEIAREEFPDHDVTVRGAVSIGRRLQDPLAELVKIDPKAIGVGQYQHDVDQRRLKERLDDVVTACVNGVGVDLNTASAPLLSYVSGLGPTLAKAVVAHRDARGAFRSRQELLAVPRLGEKTFQQAAGFLRVRGDNPLDATGVHPERYDLVERMAADLGRAPADLAGAPNLLKTIDFTRYLCDDVGRYTLDDILAELAAPGRDPRDEFAAVAFRDDVHELEDLREGMDLEGVVTNVTHFGAFVDVGVHQDGLVHVSEIAHRFVRDPADELHVGQRVQVRVRSVDRERRRIGLSIKDRLPAA
ncbi:MAG TPA: Tex family protein [Candidatus Krumholzibacteria bacterium]|nr:Tex family protein [Candidatus Krumholzibacteria bacterium]